MTEQRRQILDMLAAGQINADEAERLIAALEKGSNGSAGTDPSGAPKPRAKYLRVVVKSEDESDGPSEVDVRVPMQLLRAGVRLASLIPEEAHRQINLELKERGVAFDLRQLKPENLEELIDNLEDLTVRVDQPKTQTKVRVFAE
ncbi:MAG: hypothetical protein ABI823_11940 [Bryobacteraceae bacterium]